MNEDIEPDLLLDGQHMINLGAQRGVVTSITKAPGAPRCPGPSKFGRLGKRPDRGRRQGRERQFCPLGRRPFAGSLGPAGINPGKGFDTLSDHLVRHTRRVPPGGKDALIGVELVGNGVATVRDPPGQYGQLVQFLVGERQPGTYLFVEVLGGGGPQGYMQQRARCGDDNLRGELRQLVEQVETGVQIVGPDVSAVHHARQEHLVPEATRGLQQMEVLRASAEVEAHRLDRQIIHIFHGGSHMTEVRRQRDLRPIRVVAEPLVDAAQSSQFVGTALLHQCGLVDAYPRSATPLELGQDLDVRVNKGIEQSQHVEPCMHRGTPQ